MEAWPEHLVSRQQANLGNQVVRNFLANGLLLVNNPFKRRFQ
jgi:hypothetical protein